MARECKFFCNHCRRHLQARSEPNQFYINEEGQKIYPTSSDEEGLAKCIAHDVNNLCLDCGKKFKIDSRKPKAKCPKCRSTNFYDTWQLHGKKCPYCRKGTFYKNPLSTITSKK